MNDAPKISPAMIEIYDEYTHLTLDRRGFMEKLTKLAGSGAAAAALVPVLGNNYARAALVMEDDSRLAVERVEYPGAGGVTMKGYLARPVDVAGPLPSVMSAGGRMLSRHGTYRRYSAGSPSMNEQFWNCSGG
jgi:carboxymethylenebutenolidase